MKKWTRRAVWGALLVAVAVLLVRAFRPVAVLVDVATVARGALQVTVDDDGRTRVRERYTISAPLPGRLLRTPLDPGDEVIARETAVAEFVPLAPELLDARSRAESEARLRRAEAALAMAQARREQAAADQGYATSDLARVRGLAGQGIVAREELDQALRDERQAQEGLRAASFAVRVAEFELEVARASLQEVLPEELEESPDSVEPDPQPPQAQGSSGPLVLRSPITGTVLRVFEESTRTLAAGDRILEVGNTEALEIVADYLSQDAVQVRPGMQVLVRGFGGLDERGEPRVLRGRVRVVEPGGFTKVSALGVEEQRVNVLVDPADEDPAWRSLGDEFRVELSILLWSQDDVLRVPTAALFRAGDGWCTFVVDGDRLRQREVVLGRRGDLQAQVLEGLAAGDQVVLYPGEALAEGTRVEVR